MPQLEAALFDYLSTDPGVSALVSTRVYPVRGPERATLPYVSYQRISSSRLYPYSPDETDEAWTRARVQFDCWATTPLEAIEVGESLLAALSGHDGDMGGQLVSVSGVSEFDAYERDTKLYRRSLDFFVLFEDDLSS